MRFAFGDCIVDRRRRVLARDGANVRVEPKVFDLIVYLIECRERAVTKTELIDAIWDGRAVSDASLTTAVRSARRAIDAERGTSAISTLPRVGYRFAASVDVLSDEQTAQPEPPDEISTAPHLIAVARADGLPLKPSIAVVPFDTMSDNQDHRHFTDGLTEDLITALSQFKELSVAGRNSSFALRDLSLTSPEVGERMGVRFLLKGSIRWAGQRMRITAQMVEASTDQHVWARQYDRDASDMFDVLDDVTSAITCVILSSIVVAEQRRIEALPTESLNPWECYHRAYKLAEAADLNSKREALRIWERSIEIDPNFVEGAALLVRASSVYCAQCGPTQERQSIIERAKQVAAHAIHIDPHHDLMWSATVNLHAHCGEIDKAMNAASKAWDLNPQGQHVLYANGLANMVAGNFEEAIAFYEKLLALGRDITIRHPAKAISAAANVNLGRYEDAIALCRSAQLEPGADVRSYIGEISACGHLGRHEEAEAALKGAKVCKPDIGFAYLTYCHPFGPTNANARLHDGLRKAAFPD